MSESFQEFCKRILPVVQAGAEGKKIECFGECTREWRNKVSKGFVSDSKYRTADHQEFTVNVKLFKTAEEMLKELDGVKTTANTPTEEGVRPKNFCAACGSEVNLGMRVRNLYQASMMNSPEKVEEKRDLDELKSQATHYMQKVGGKMYLRRFEGRWMVLHEPTQSWLSVYLVDESKLIEIK